MIVIRGNPKSKLNELRKSKAKALIALQEANARKDPQRGKHLGAYNSARMALKRHLEGKPEVEVHPVDLEITIKGIPAGVVIKSYQAPKTWRQHIFPGAGPGDCDPPEGGEVRWVITDSKGREAQWLFDKVDESEFETFVLNLIEDMNATTSY